jgi:hypothetical protein
MTTWIRSFVLRVPLAPAALYLLLTAGVLCAQPAGTTATGAPPRISATATPAATTQNTLARPATATTTSAAAVATHATVAAGHAAQQAPGWDSYVRGFGILILFLIIAALIATRKLPAMVALPLMALGIGLIAGIPLFGPDGVLVGILEGGGTKGAFMLYKAMIYSILGGMFARFIQDAKIAERLVKYAAEYGGENPFIVALFMSAIIVLIFTAIGGLPAIIMVGTVMFPVLLSLGVAPSTVGGIMLLAFPIGLSLSPANWKVRAEQYAVDTSVVMTYSLIWAGIQAVILVAFLSIEFLRMKRSPVHLATVVRSILLLTGTALGAALVLSLPWLARQALLLGENMSAGAASYGGMLAGLLKGFGSFGVAMTQSLAPAGAVLWTATRGLLWIVIGLGVLLSQWEYLRTGRLTREFNLLTPALPLLFILVLGFGDAYGPAFLAALAYGFLTTPRERAMQRLSRSIMEGVGDVAAPVVLLMGIGMLVTAAMHPTVANLISPLIAGFIPTKPLPYIIFFFLASPLSLYRGPLNEWGLGVGVARILSAFMPAPATMGAIQSVTMLQDPTTTQNVWICGYLKLDINALLFKLFAYSLVLVLAGLTLSAIMFF